MPIYKLNGEVYDIPEDVVADFEKDNPNATVTFNADGDEYDIPISEREAFLKDFPGATVGSAQAVVEQKPTEQKPSNNPALDPAEFQGTIGKARQTVGQTQQSVNRIGNMQKRMGLDLPQEPVRLGQNRKVTKGEQRFNLDKGRMESTYVTKAGNEYENRAMADIEQNLEDQAEWERNNPKEALKQRIESQIRDIDSRMSGYQGEWVDADGRVHYSGGSAGDEAMRNLENARHDLMESLQQMERSETLSKSDGILGGIGLPFTKDFFNNWKNFGYAVWDRMNDVGWWENALTGGINDLEKAGAYMKIKNKLDQGRELSDQEMDVVLAGMASAQAQKYIDLPLGYTAGTITADMAPFMAQMAINPAGGLGKTVARQAVRKFGRNGIGAISARVAGRVLGNVGEAAVLSNTLQAPRNIGNIMQRNAGDSFMYDEDGNLHMGHYEDDDNGNPVFVEGGKGILRSAYEGEASSIIENFTELGTGGSINKFVKKMAASKAGRAFGIDYLTDLIGKIGTTPFAKGMKRFMERTHWDGMIEEPLEEEYGIILNSLLGTGDAKISDLWDSEEQAKIFAGTLWFGGMMGAMNTAAYPLYRRNLKKQVAQADINGQAAFGQQWDQIKESVEALDDKEIGNFLYGIKDDDAYTNEQKAALFGYAARLKQYQGANVGDMLTRMENNLSSPEKAIGNAYERGADADTPDEKKQYVDDLQAAEQALPEYGQEFARMVAESQNPVETLDYLMQNRDYFTDDQIAAAADFFQKQARAQGVMDAALDGVDLEVEKANSEVRANMHQQTGQVITAQIGDGAYYIIGGDVVTDGETGMPVVTGTGGAVVVKDPMTGEVSVKPAQQAAITSMTNADDMIRYNESVLRQELTQQADDDVTYGSPANEVFDLEDTVTLQDGNGGIIEGQVVTLPNAVDGVFVIQTADGRALQMTADDINRRIVAHNGQEVQRVNQNVNQQPENIPEEGNNDNQNIPETNTNTVREVPEVEQPASEGRDENMRREDEGEGARVEAAPSPEHQQSALDRIPVRTDKDGQPLKNKKGRPVLDWHKASVEDAAAALVETTNGNMVMARDTASDLVRQAQDRKEKIAKQKPKGEDPIEIAESRMEIQKQLDEQQAIIKQWQDVGTAIRKQMEAAEAERRAVEEAAKSAEQKAREAEEARIRKEKQDAIDAERRRKKIEEELASWNKPYAPLAKARKEMESDPDAMDILNRTEPESLEEWVSSLIQPQSMMWDDETDPVTGRTVIGLQSELGLQKKDIERIGGLVASSQKGGKPFGQVVHDIWEQLPEGLKNMYDDQDVRNTLIGLFGEGNAMRMRHLTEEHRIEEARAMMKENERRDREAEMDAWAEAYHLTPEERETFEEWMNQPPTEPEQEIINQIIADNEQNRTSTRLDQRPDSGEDAEAAETGENVQEEAEAADLGNPTEADFQGTEAATGEQAAANDAVSGFDREAEVSRQAPADNNVPGGESIFVTPVLNVSLSRQLVNDLAEAYASGDPSAIRSAVVAMKAYVDEGGDFENKEAEDYFDYDGNDPQKLALQYKERVLLDTYLEDDEDQEYIKTGLKPEMRQVQKQSAPIGKTSTPAEIKAEEAKVDTNPTEGQKEAGNYQKGHINIDGYDISIENPKGSKRRGTDANGKEWETTMHNTYGYIRGTEGVDGDHIDVFLSDEPASGSVFVVDQVNPSTGDFDEHKVMYGFNSEEDARQAYISNYQEGWQGLGAITEVSREEFKKWVESSHRKTKPFSEYKSVKKERPGTDTPEGEILVKGGTIMKNNIAGGDAVVRIIGSNIDKKTGKRRYSVEYYTDEQAVKERIAIGDAEIGQDEMRQHLANGDFSEIDKSEDEYKVKRPSLNPDYNKYSERESLEREKGVLEGFVAKYEEELSKNGKLRDWDKKQLSKSKKRLDEINKRLTELDANTSQEVEKEETKQRGRSGRAVQKEDGEKIPGSVQNAGFGRGRVAPPSSSEKIEDVGEQIAGARKDMTRKIAQTIDSATKQTLAELPFSKAYKKPDLKKAVEEGALRESDATFYDAWFATMVNPTKPKVSQSEMRMKKHVPDYKTKMEKWVDQTYDALQVLKMFVEASEEERDAMIGRLLEDKYPNREEQLAKIEKLRSRWTEKNQEDLNKAVAATSEDGQAIAEERKAEFGDKTTPNPLWITYEVMKQMDYTPGDKVDIPFGKVEANYTGTGYTLLNNKGERNYDLKPKTIEEAIDDIVYLAKLKRGDADIQHPVSMFYSVPTKTEYKENGQYRVFWGPWNRQQSRDFDNKEDADAFVAKKPGSYAMPIREVARRFGYKTMYRHPLTGEKMAVNDQEFDTKEEARNYIEGNYETLNSELNTLLSKDKEAGPKKELKPDDIIYTAIVRGNDGKYTHAVLLDKRYANNFGDPLIIKEGFGSRDEAKAFADSVKDSLFKTYQSYKNKMRSFTFFDTGSDSRKGEDYRGGRDVTAEDFMNTFGFRGVQFGNWTNQRDRQTAVNQAYDSFLDLAKLLGVSPKAMSLNGELGIAFGARGSGNFAAHYEPGEVVINLTKTMGAGSLAHEWWHALDNYFARSSGQSMGMVTDDKTIPMRQELRDAFNALLDQVRKSNYYSRSKGKGDYWGRMHEVTARLLSEWVDQELKERGELNTFLSRGAKTEGVMKINYERYKAHAEITGQEPMPFEEYQKLDEAMSGSAYPSQAEVERFSDAMRNIFDVMEEREDPETGKVALYQKVAPEGVQPQTEEDNTLRDALIEEMRNAGIDVITDTEEGQKTLDEANGKDIEQIRQQKVYHGSGAEFDAFDHSHIGEGEGSQAFGWGTYVTDSEGIGKSYARRGRNRNVLYDVEIPDDNGKNYLDWQDVVSDELLERVKKAVEEQESDEVNADYFLEKLDEFMDMNNPLGSDLYRMLQKYAFNGDAERTSKFLSGLGLTGIRYPAGTIYGNGNGSTNYVIFNEADARITDVTRFFRTSDGHAYGYTYNGKIYVDPRIATSETPIHEYGHLWAEMKRQTAPDEWDDIKEVLMNDPSVQPFIDKVRQQYPELTAEGREDDFIEEVLAQYSGRRGSERMREVAAEVARENGGVFGKAQAVEALRKMRNILSKFWQGIARMMGWRYGSAEQVADSMLYDLLSGVNPTDPTGVPKDTESLKDYVLSEFNRAKNGNALGERIPFGKLTEEGRKYLEHISGMTMKPDVSFILNASELRHIYNDHYGDNEKDKGNNMPLTDDDIRSLVDVVTSPDKIVFAVENKTGRKLFFFLKNAGNGTYNLAEVYADSRGNLTTKSFYKTKKSIAQRANELLKDPKLSTSETDGESSFSGANIPKLFETSKDLPEKVQGNGIKQQKADTSEAENNGPIRQGESIFDYARRMVERREKKIDEAAPEPTAESVARDIYENAIRDTGEAMMIPALFRALGSKEARERFKHKFAESWFDYTRSIRALQEAIEKATGNKIQSFEDVWKTLNAKSSIDSVELQRVMSDLIQPLSEFVGNMVLGKKIEGHKMTIDDVEKYLNAVHGIERNEQMAMKQALDEYNEDIAVLKQQLEKGELSDKERKSVEASLIKKEARFKGIKHYMDNEEVAKWYRQWERDLDTALRKGNITEAEYKKERQKMMDEYENGQQYKYRNKDYSGLTALFGEDTEDGKKPTEEQLEQSAREYAAEFEKIVGKELTDGLWERVKALNGWSLRKAYESGLVSRQQYEDTRRMYQHYVPLRGWHDDYAGDVYQFIARGEPAEVLQGVLKKAYGRKSRAARIFGTMAAMANTAIVQGNKNIVAQNLLNMALNHADSGLLMVNEQYYQKDADGNIIPLFPKLDEKMTADEMRQELERFDEQMKQMEDNGEVQRYSKKFAREFPLHMAKWQERQHAVRVMRNGKEYMVYILGSPRAAQAFNGLLNPNSRPGIISDTISKYMRFLAKMQTSLSPEFLISNFQRDVTTAATGAYVKYGKEYQKDFIKNVTSIMPLTKAMLKKAKGEDARNWGGIFSLFRKYDAGTLDMNDDTERYFKEFIESGGMTGISFITKSEEYQDSMEKIVKRMRQGKLGKVKNARKTVADAVEFANKGIENATRFATYMTSRQHGKNVRDSIFDAKEGSVNFNMKGSGAWGNMFARRNFLYVNPAMQALRMIGTWYENDPEVAVRKGAQMATKEVGRRFMKAAAMTLAASTTTAMLNIMLSALLHGDGDDDEKKGMSDKSDWWSLSEWNRYNYINIINPFGNGYFHWSIPQEMRPVWALGQIGVDMAFGRITPQRGLQSMLLQLNNLSPLSFFEGGTDTGESIVESELRTMTPSYVSPFTDALLWNRDFMGHPITNRGDWNKDKPEWQRAGKNTPEIMINASRKINEMTGGRTNKRGWLENDLIDGLNNPSALYYILTQQFGGIGSMARRSMNFYDQWRDPEQDVEVRNMPFVPKFYVETGDDFSKQRVTNDKFWMYWNEYKDADNELSADRSDVKNGKMKQEDADRHIEERKADGTYDRWKLIEDNNLDNIFKEARGTDLEGRVKKMVVDMMESGKAPDWQAMLESREEKPNYGLWVKALDKQRTAHAADITTGQAMREFDEADEYMRPYLAKKISKDAGASEDPYGGKPQSDHAYQYQLQRTAQDVWEDALLLDYQENAKDKKDDALKKQVSKDRSEVHNPPIRLHGGKSDTAIMNNIRQGRQRLLKKYGLDKNKPPKSEAESK